MKKFFSFLCSVFPKSIQPPKDNLINIVNQFASTSYNSSCSTLLLALAAPAANLSLKFPSDNTSCSSNRTSRSVSRSSSRNKRRTSYFD